MLDGGYQPITKPPTRLKKEERCGPLGCGRLLGYRVGDLFVTNDGLQIVARDSYGIRCLCDRVKRFYVTTTKKQRANF